MMTHHWYSPAQCLGYLAFVLGVATFFQRADRRFKLFNIGECLAYAAHFALLGIPTALAGSVMSALRSVLSLRTQSRWVAAAVLASNVVFGLAVATRPADWLPLLASCLGTLALFLLDGIAMRWVMLCAIGLWIANNIIVGSIGGTALEAVVGVVDVVTIFRLWTGRDVPPPDHPT